MDSMSGVWTQIEDIPSYEDYRGILWWETNGRDNRLCVHDYGNGSTTYLLNAELLSVKYHFGASGAKDDITYVGTKKWNEC